MIFYTVHENREIANPDARLAFVKQGFNWLGLISPLLWCLYRLEWRGFLAYLLVLLVVFGLLGTAGAGEDAMTFAGFGINLLVGFFANDWRRAMLARCHYRLVAVVGGRTQSEAELRYFRGVSEDAPARPAAAAPRLDAQGTNMPWAVFPTSIG